MELSKPLEKFQLKAEFKALFTNLATGEQLTQGDAFRPSPTSPKSYSSAELAATHRKLLDALVAAGFIAIIETDVVAVTK